MMSRRLRPLVALTAVVLISMLSAGCGSNTPSSSGTASNVSDADNGRTKPTNDQANGVKFAECIRNHGVTDFPDPDAKGEFNYGVSVTPAVWQRAVNACKALEPPGALSSERTPKAQTAGLKIAQCIRENGVKDFPDPVNGEPLINTYKIPSTDRPGGMTALNAAIANCRPLMDAAMAAGK
jgi:hypothetical protein